METIDGKILLSQRGNLAYYRSRLHNLPDSVRPVESVIIKAYLTQDCHRLLVEYRLLTELPQSTAWLKPLSIESSPIGSILIFPDRPFHTLRQHLLPKKPDSGGGCLSPVGKNANHTFLLHDFLKCASLICSALDEIRRQHMIHKSITPDTILVNFDDTNSPVSVTLIDFEYADNGGNKYSVDADQWLNQGTAAREKVVLPSASEVEYMAPEAARRMNRSVDYRSDYYSLGVTMYEMVTGQIPFSGTDSLEIIHQHMAKTPATPHSLNPFIPKAVSAIIMKCMEKVSEDRYSHALGIKSDLDALFAIVTDFQCHWATGVPVEDQNVQQYMDSIPFRTGWYDYRSRLIVPHRLYGREDAFCLLRDRYAEVRNGACELVLVSGYSGVGKSSLINEVQPLLASSYGFWISGKADQYQRATPLHCFIQVFKEVVRQLLMKPTSTLISWQDKLLAALDGQGRVMTDVIPELVDIIGSQEKVPELPPQQAEQRFRDVVARFFNIFGTKEAPLVVFLDDLQWADTGTLDLIKSLVTNRTISPLMIIGAYRSNEVDKLHPLTACINTISATTPERLTAISLPPLDVKCVKQLLNDTLYVEGSSELAALAVLIHGKTEGNPYFVIQFLSALSSDDLLKFCWEDHVWKWDIDQLKSRITLADNVVDFMVSHLKKLPAQGQHVLAFAACIGNRFSVHTLSVAMGKSITDTFTDMWSAIEAGCIFSADEKCKDLLVCTENENDVADLLRGLWFTFTHDRVQQASYALIPIEERKKIHLMIGGLMLNHYEEALKQNDRDNTSVDVNVFEIVGHLNHGIDELLLQNENDGFIYMDTGGTTGQRMVLTRQKLANLNCIVALKAKEATFFDTAIIYLRIGVDLLPTTNWSQEEYPLALTLYLAAIETEWHLTYCDRANTLASIAMENARCRVDKAKVFCLKLKILISEGKTLESIDSGLECLRMLGTPVPEDPASATELAQKVNSIYTLDSLDGIANLPTMTNEEAKLSCTILTILLSAVYFGRPDLLVPVIHNIALLTATDGICPPSAYGVCLLGLVCSCTVETIPLGHSLGKVAIQMLSNFPADAICCPVYKVFASHIQPWSEPYKNSLPNFEMSIKQGMATVNSEYLGYGVAEYIVMAVLSGDNIDSVVKRCRPRIEVVYRLGHDIAIPYLNLPLHYLLDLSGVPNGSESSPRFDGNREQGSKKTIFLMYCVDALWNLIVSYIFCDYEAAAAVGKRCKELLKGSPGLFWCADFLYFEALSLLSVHQTIGSDDEKQIALARVEENMSALRKWADRCPANFESKWQLVAAELARVRGLFLPSVDHYDTAIKHARSSGLCMEEALAYERLSNYYHAHERYRLARDYAIEAYYTWAHWGANRKAEKMAETNTYIRNWLMETPKNSRSQQSPQSNLDFKVVIEASLAISQEIVLDNLIAKLMQVVLKLAGGQKAVLILQRDGELTIEASAVAEGTQDPCIGHTSQKMEGSNLVPISVVNYVARTKTSLITCPSEVATDTWQDDAGGKCTVTLATYSTRIDLRSAMQLNDEYFTHHKPKSMLCSPILHQGKVTGVLYLENNLTADAFTTDRLEILQLLSAQAASSIENALLYTWLQKQNKQLEEYSKTLSVKVEERTAELREKNSQLELEIRERQEAEKAMLHAKEVAEAATAEKSRFLANMSHEIRTPMNAVIGMTQCLSQTELTAMQRDYVSLLLTSSEELLTLINDILDYSKIESGHLDFDEHAFSLRSCIEGAIDILAPKAFTQGLEIMCSQTFEEPDIFLGDSSRLRQILVNLLSNAVKFTYTGEVVVKVNVEKHDSFADATAQATNPNVYPRERATLYTPIVKEGTVTTPRASTGNLVAGWSTIKISVSDTGIGIPADRMCKLFRSFSQVDASTTRVFGGTGLGLAISKRLVELMAGTMWVESDNDHGSTFHFTIVLRIGPDAKAPICYRSLLEKKAVLIVVGNRTLSEILAKYCDMWGMQPTTANTWRDASPMFYHAESPFVLCLLESKMISSSDTIQPSQSDERASTEINSYSPETVTFLKNSRPIILLVPFGQQVPESCKTISKVLMKPVKMARMRGAFRDVIAGRDKVLLASTDPPSASRPSLMLPSPSSGNPSMRSPSSNPTTPDELPPLKLLLTDDNTVNQRVGIQLLKLLHVVGVQLASNGQEAIDALTKPGIEPFDAILMDVQMPVMDGLQATRYIREHLPEPLRSITIIGVTANAMIGDRDAVIQAGMDDYVSKPIRIGDLRAALLRIKPPLLKERILDSPDPT